MNTIVDTVVIGAGHAGLAVSHLLGRAGRDHVVIDRGDVAQAWRTRWDSLTLLTPRWMSRLPGWRYRGPGQEGFMPAAELVGHLEAYAAASSAPLALGREVLEVARRGERYRVTTTDGTWTARHVVVATGPGDRAMLPPAIDDLDPGVPRVPALAYRNPDGLGQCWSSADPRPAPRSPTSWPGPAAAWCWPWAGTPGSRAATAAWT